MATALVDHQARVGVPRHWPRTLHPHALAKIDEPTPYLICDLDTVADRYQRLTAALPGVHPFYAMKCNSSPEVLKALAALGSGFEVASLGGLRQLQEIGVITAGGLLAWAAGRALRRARPMGAGPAAESA
jgi:ornithine decarboxylase